MFGFGRRKARPPREHGFVHRDTPRKPEGNEPPPASAPRTLGLLGMGSRVPTELPPRHESPEAPPEGRLDTGSLPRRRGERL